MYAFVFSVFLNTKTLNAYESAFKGEFEEQPQNTNTKHWKHTDHQRRKFGQTGPTWSSQNFSRQNDPATIKV